MRGLVHAALGAKGDEGEAVLDEGDVICMPTWMFCGFSNSGARHGFLTTVLGGDDTGGIIWSPEVMRRARGNSSGSAGTTS